VHLPLSDLSPAPDSRNLDVVSEPSAESVGQHGEHPLEVLLLRVRRESKVVKLKSVPVGGLPQYVGAIVPPAVGFQEPDGARCRVERGMSGGRDSSLGVLASNAEAVERQISADLAALHCAKIP
jgi:hypothetical protein